MHVVISRTKVHLETVAQGPRDSENPYVFKPKSYSTKRNASQDNNEKLLRSSPNKKVKKDTPSKRQQSTQFSYHWDDLLKQLALKPNSFFGPEFFDKHPTEDLKVSPLTNEPQLSFEQKMLNPMMKNQITIVSNKNQKIQTLIHEGLLLANTAHAKVGKDQHFLKDVANPFDYTKRNEYLNTIRFERDYKSGYAPIQMQQKNVEEPEENNNTYAQVSKTHFIRKKQSTLSLPRSCGVSYIKPSESHQTHPFEPLPPLIFQCSSRCGDSKEIRDKYQHLSNILNSLSMTTWMPYIQCTEDEMRDLLLGKKIGQVGWVRGVQNLWPLFSEGTFFLVLYSAEKPNNADQIWTLFGKSPFKIGVLVKRSTSGKKAFLKSLNIKEAKSEEQVREEEKQNGTSEAFTPEKPSQEFTIHQEHKVSTSLEEDIANELRDCRTVLTLSLRLQMYVQQQQWKSYGREQKQMLNFLITNLKDTIEKGSLQIIRKRLILAKSPQQKGPIVEEIVSNLREPLARQMSTEQQLKKSTILVTDSQLVSFFQNQLYQQGSYEKRISSISQNIKLQNIFKTNRSESSWQKNLKMPLYYISTRDSFAFDLVEKVTLHTRANGQKYKKIEYYFEPENLPTNYGKQYRQRFPLLDVGITCYHDFFTNEQLNQYEANTFATETNAFKNKFLQMTVQPSIVGSKIKRTKFFFGYRYMWTRCQLAEPGSYIGAGVRRDVTSRPKWTNKIIDAFVKDNLAEKDFINSIAINVYHDGKQGLAQHFDDAVRFRQPIYTLRLFSDARLSFGSQFYGFCNGAFIIPLPRGCICVMEQNSYAANGVKHCVRPADMTGKSAAVILRQMHHKVVEESKRYDQLIDFPAWVSCLSSAPDAVTFAEQKRREAQYCINNPKQEPAK